jgi:hypothetical protein
VLSNGTGTNDKIIVLIWGYEKPHVTKNPCALLVIPRQVNCGYWNEFVVSDADGTFLFLFGQLLKVCLGQLEDVEDEFPRHDIPLVVAGIDGTFSFLGDKLLIAILSAGQHVHRQNPR